MEEEKLWELSDSQLREKLAQDGVTDPKFADILVSFRNGMQDTASEFERKVEEDFGLRPRRSVWQRIKSLFS